MNMNTSTHKLILAVSALLGAVAWVIAQSMPSCRHCDYQLDSQPNCTSAGPACALTHYSEPGICNLVTGAISDDTGGAEQYAEVPMTTETVTLVTCTMSGTCVLGATGQFYCSYSTGFVCTTSHPPRMALEICQ
jgi:hypothetical protein